MNMKNGALMVKCEFCKGEAVLHAHVMRNGRYRTVCYECLTKNRAK